MSAENETVSLSASASTNSPVGKTILVLGGTGSLGQALAAAWGQKNRLVVFSRDENKQWAMRIKFPQLTYLLGDVRNPDSLRRAFLQCRPDLVIMAAALKHVDFCEDNVVECVATNVRGVANTLEAAAREGKKGLDYVFVSTDKACSPINAYGMSKALAERLVAEAAARDPERRYLVVRYGNVINSRGSVVEKFGRMTREAVKTQLETNSETNSETKQISPVVFQVTDPRMTRFFMTLRQSIGLIEQALARGVGGETWVAKALAFNIHDLALYCAAKCGGVVEFSGLRSAEKLVETLLNEQEASRSREEGDFFVFSGRWKQDREAVPYDSSKVEKFELLVPQLEASWEESSH